MDAPPSFRSGSIFAERYCYFIGASYEAPGRRQALRRLTLFPEGNTSCPQSKEKGVVNAVSFDELFQFCLVLIGFACLIFQIAKKVTVRLAS